MNIMKELQNPSIRNFSEEVKELELEQLIERKRDIDTALEYGLFPDWAIYSSLTSSSKRELNYWDLSDILRYRKNILMEMLDRCKSFELYPKLKFYF